MGHLHLHGVVLMLDGVAGRFVAMTVDEHVR